jgi:hypothetical protein
MVSATLLSALVASCAPYIPSGSPQTTVSSELVTFLNQADYVIVCRKKGMKLYIMETLKGSLQVGRVYATFSRSSNPRFDIDPNQTWTDLVVRVPGRFAYFPISPGGVIDWIDAKDPQHRRVLLRDLREYYRRPNQSQEPTSGRRDQPPVS